MSWKTRKWWRPSRDGSIAIAILALLFVVTAFSQGWITPPTWYTSLVRSIAPAPRVSERVTSAQAAASARAAQLAAEAASTSAKFAEEGSAKNASSAAFAAKAASASAAKAEASAEAARKAAEAKSRSAKKKDEAKPSVAEKSATAAVQVRSEAAVEPRASGGFNWVRFGTAPYASSREEAMQKRQSAFRALGFSDAVVAKLMIATEKPGEKVRINVGDKLDAMLSKGGVVHTNVTAAFGSPSRGMELAAPAEKWTVTWEGKTYTALLPEVCNNWSSVVGILPPAPVAAVPPPPAPRPIAKSSVCPDGWSLTANAWQLESLPSGMRQEAETLIAAAEARESDNARRLEPYKPDAVSRTMGRRLREQVKVRASVNADIIVRFIDPQTASVVRELGTLQAVNGIGIFRFDEDPRPYVVETLWPISFDSPTMSGGHRRIRLFGSEWTGICAMNEHGLVRGR